MYKISTLNKISPVGLSLLTDKYELCDQVSGSSGILVRSQNMLDMEFDDQLFAIARAGAGVNNIPADKCAEKGIVVFNTPGANANAVKELTLAGLFLAARNIPAGIEWEKTLENDVLKAVEKGKSRFAGTEIMGKTIGVMGLGAIGVMVANAVADLGMKVIGYDPYFSTKSAHQLSCTVSVVDKIEDAIPECDYITIHIPAMDSTKGMFNKKLFDIMKPDTVLLNFSRDKLVSEADLTAAMEEGRIRTYVTDFATDTLLKNDKVIALPHLGASTAEAEDNCATMAVKQIMDYIENGNIVNSVNYPAVSLGTLKDNTRIVIMTKGEEDPVGFVCGLLSGTTLTAIAGKARGEYGYVIADTSADITDLPESDKIIRSRIIKA